jgi:hypothetical protein
MREAYDLITALTSPSLPFRGRERILNDFALEFGWQPSDSLDAPIVAEFSNAHLVVEHGLENAAVISFLRSDKSFSSLDFQQKRNLLSLSYNNLVDWHIQIELDRVTFLYNRSEPFFTAEYGISPGKLSHLKWERFEQAIGKKPNPNLPALDTALIDTISFWKRRLYAESDYNLSNQELSALFNAIIFVRAMEDYNRSFNYLYDTDKEGTLLDIVKSGYRELPLREIMRHHLSVMIKKNPPLYIINDQLLTAFDTLHQRTLMTMLHDFYQNKYAPFDYDFSIMSKHALSRIYEHYVSILHLEETNQLSMFPRFPEEEWNKAFGSIYTPQFIARFFAKFLREQMAPSAYKNILTADPACGSGIFLRTLLELQNDITQNGINTNQIKRSFQNVFGLDIDENASQATRLSLSLLHLVLTGELPERLNIYTANSFEFYQKHLPELVESFDAIIANPPFISLASQSPQMRKYLSDFMSDLASGRIDAYQAFLQIGLQMLKPGGFGLFVLPHSFLLGKNARGMRDLIHETCWIRCLADLSAIRVFDHTGSYIVLLIFQKIPNKEYRAPNAIIIKCQDSVGKALQDALEGRILESNLYSIYELDQSFFANPDWPVLPPTESYLKRKLERLPAISEYLDIGLGFISGADNIFIVPRQLVPKGEGSIYEPFVPDREMSRYKINPKTNSFFIYPFLAGRKLTEHDFSNSFPSTWQYLLSKREELEKRSQVKKGNLNWWEPERPRSYLMNPKIITPHLVITSRFSLDLKGEYAVSRAPIFYLKNKYLENDLLCYFVAVLNSIPCFWYIQNYSHKYRHGYLMLEPKTLKLTPVPDPEKVPPITMRNVITLVKKVLATTDEKESSLIEDELNDIITDLYGLTEQEIRTLGV